MKVNVLEYLNSIIEGTEVSKISIKRSNSKIVIKRNPGVKPLKASAQPQESKESPKPAESTKSSNDFTVKSKTVGIFYRGTAKNDSPVVKIGDVVKKGSVLGVINCMGVMEKVISPVSGKIKEILVENQKPVEYGNPLFIIEKN